MFLFGSLFLSLPLLGSAWAMTVSAQPGGAPASPVQVVRATGTLGRAARRGGQVCVLQVTSLRK